MGALRGAGARPGGRRLTEPSVGRFSVDLRSGAPRELLVVPSVSSPTAFACEPTSGALVLGSTQHDSAIDRRRCAAAGLDVLRRRSGGAAVIVRPGAQVWIDVFVPRDDRRYDDDIQASFAFLGSAWRAAFAEVFPATPGRLEVHTGAVKRTSWSRVLCFAGLGAGEVTLQGHKVVGISQRRDRSGAWFHSMAMLQFDPGELPALLGLVGDELDEATAVAASRAVAVPGGPDAGSRLLAAVLDNLD